LDGSKKFDTIEFGHGCNGGSGRLVELWRKHQNGMGF